LGTHPTQIINTIDRCIPPVSQVFVQATHGQTLRAGDFFWCIIPKMKNLHHAYVIEGERERALKRLFEFLESDLDFNIKGNPDFQQDNFDTFGIDDGRVLKERQSKKAFTENGKKIFVVSLNSITHEAQNSLLKVFEEPTKDTHFFLIVPSIEIFLPTVRSRVETLFFSDIKKLTENEFGKKFLYSSIPERFKILESIIENKDKNIAIQFLNNLESNLYEILGNDLDKNKSDVFNQIITCKKYLGDRSPSIKMIMEHVALVTPVFVG
jgi:hypothetical protein